MSNTDKQEGEPSAGPQASPETEQWSFEDRLKYALVPPWLYVRYRAWKELRSGEAEATLLPLLVNRNRNAVDAGANKGTYTYLLSRLCRHVHAFEPYPKMLGILRRTARSNVSVVAAALSDMSGTASFRVPRHRKGGLSNQGGSLSAVKVDGPHVAFEVSTAMSDS
ncbi:MAG: FkbM family methyltransferase [Rhodospirillaceae bacterium]